MPTTDVGIAIWIIMHRCLFYAKYNSSPYIHHVSIIFIFNASEKFPCMHLVSVPLEFRPVSSIHKGPKNLYILYVNDGSSEMWKECTGQSFTIISDSGRNNEFHCYCVLQLNMHYSEIFA